jgi:cytidine deaminase
MDEELLEAAREAMENAYVPYSEYAVGAALRGADGEIYAGTNIEFANYSNTLHAEGVAVAKAVSDGVTDFEELVVVSAAGDGVTPCGRCRQTLREFCDEAFPVFCVGEEVTEYTLGELIPDAISGDML